MSRSVAAQRIYIAGPMTGIKDFNKPEFDAAKMALEEIGFEVFSPGDMTDETDDRRAMKIELEWIAKNADAIYMLDGWENSSGAFVEWSLARRLGLKIYYEVGL